MLYGYIATNGLRRIQRGRVDFENPKHAIIVSAMLVMGLGGAIWGKGMVQVSGMSMAAIFGIALNYFVPDRCAIDTPEHHEATK